MDDDRALHQARIFERFWDALVAGRPAPPENELDPDVVAVARRLQALDRPMATDVRFESTLWEDLMHAHAIEPSVPLRPIRLPHANNHPPPRGGTLLRPERRRFVRFAAAAALLVFGLGGWLLAAIIGSSGSGTSHHASIPAAQVSAEATPPAGPVAFLWETRGDPADPLGNPPFLAVAPDGNIWVTDGDHNRFQIFAPDGTHLENWGETGSGDGQFDFTTVGWGGYNHGSVAFAPDGGFYVADPGNFRIQRFGPDRRFLTAWGSEGTEPGQFRTANDLVVDGQDRVYVLDTDRATSPAVQVFDADGRFLAAWGERGSDPGQLSTPSGIGLDPTDGTILIAEFYGNRVQRFTPEGEVLDGWGGSGTDDGEFTWAHDAAVDAKGRVFVSDYSNGRVQIFDRDGRFLAAWGEYGSGPGEFSYTLGVAVDGDGTVYVADEGKRLQAFRVGDLPEPIATPSP